MSERYGWHGDIFGLPTVPSTTLGLLDTAAADAFFDGLKMELPNAAMTGRMDVWTRCAEAILKLLQSDYDRRLSASKANATPSPGAEARQP